MREIYTDEYYTEVELLNSTDLATLWFQDLTGIKYTTIKVWSESSIGARSLEKILTFRI